jgi:hypothetical protein
MRIWGYILLIIGVLFFVLFVLAETGGAHLGIVPFFVSFLLMFMGWRLRTSGRGILQPKPVATEGISSAAAAGQAAAPAAEFSTVEVPLTPEVAAVIARQNARIQRILLYIVGGCLVLFVGLGGVLAATDKTPANGRLFLFIFGGIGVATAATIYGISWLTTQRPVRKDLRGATYLRTTGPVSVVYISGGGMLRLADRAFLMNGRNGMTELSKLGWGRVDYSPHGHIILGVWDRDGKNVYCSPGYSAASGA